MKWRLAHIASLARRVNVAPSLLRAIHKHRNAVVVAVAVTIITVCVCIWIVCTIVHASDVDRGDRFGLVLLHCRRRLRRRCVGSLVCLPPPRRRPPTMTMIGDAYSSSSAKQSD